MRTAVIMMVMVMVVGQAVAGLPDVTIEPTGRDGRIDGGRVGLTWGFGGGRPAVAGFQHQDNGRAVGGGGGGDDRSWFARQVDDNWGKWLSSAATVAGYILVADNNGYWPFSGGSDRDAAEVPAVTTASDTGASAAGGGTAVNGSDNVVINVSNGGSVTVYQDSPVTTSSGE